MSSPVRCPDCSARPGRPCVEPGTDGVLYPLEGGLLHVRRMLAAIHAPQVSPLASLPADARYLDCPECHERRRHDVARVDGAVRWWACAGCGHERALDSVATPIGGAS